MRIWKKTHCKFTCGCVFFHIRNSIGMQEMTEMKRSGIEVHLCHSADKIKRRQEMMSKARSTCEFTLGFAVIRVVPGMLAFMELLLFGLVRMGQEYQVPVPIDEMIAKKMKGQGLM